jgi:hypothetical protein
MRPVGPDGSSRQPAEEDHATPEGIQVGEDDALSHQPDDSRAALEDGQVGREESEAVADDGQANQDAADDGQFAQDEPSDIPPDGNVVDEAERHEEGMEMPDQSPLDAPRFGRLLSTVRHRFAGCLIFALLRRRTARTSFSSRTTNAASISQTVSAARNSFNTSDARK